MIVIGTSLNVYPAASLLLYAPTDAEIYLIDPSEPDLNYYSDRINYIQAVASKGFPALVDSLIETYGK
jgi:NAD-dependent deacetylase